MKKLVFCALFFLFTSIVSAQTTTHTMSWTQPNDNTVNVLTYTYTVVVDALPSAPVTAACVQSGTSVNCTAPLTISNANHTVTLSVANSFGANSATINYVPGASPTTLLSFTIITKTTVP